MFDMMFTFTGLTNVKPRTGLFASDLHLHQNVAVLIACLKTEIVLVCYLWQEHMAV